MKKTVAEQGSLCRNSGVTGITLIDMVLRKMKISQEWLQKYWQIGGDRSPVGARLKLLAFVPRKHASI